MKRLLCFFIIFVLFLPINVFATNINGTGGGDKQTSEGTWNPTSQGLRISLVTKDGELVGRPIDIVKHKPIFTKFIGSTCKLEIIKTESLNLAELNIKIWDSDPYPEPIYYDSNGVAHGNGIAVKNFFISDHQYFEKLFNYLGTSSIQAAFNNYKLVMEPVFWFGLPTEPSTVFYGSISEWAYFDKANTESGIDTQLTSRMGLLTRNIGPRCMVLERPDLGMPAASTAGSYNIPYKDIINMYGVIIFTSTTPLETSAKNYVYRTDTDVITSVKIKEKNGMDIKPTPEQFNNNEAVINTEFISDSPDIIGNTPAQCYGVGANGETYIWIKWHTPSYPCEVNFTVNVPLSQGAVPINCRIEELSEATPPDPKGTDRLDKFVFNKTNVDNSKKSLEWTTYVPESDGSGNITLRKINNYARLEINSNLIKPDASVPTSKMFFNTFLMKSGYPLNVTLLPHISSNSSDITAVQNGVCRFPEFGYGTYHRVLEKTSDTTFEFRANPFSINSSRVHFTPIWYPDRDYPVLVNTFDAWTPEGMLESFDYTSNIRISDSVYNDWHIVGW